ncbi:hypothetical protein RN04_14760 [Arthrobacter sp. W1]|nr:hypothetical protein RN04_14760 [Arthrobacter sp. W1]
MIIDILLAVCRGIGLTLYITVASLVIGGIAGLVLAAGARSRSVLIRMIVSAYVNSVRVIPPITWLFLIYFGLPQFALKLSTLEAAIGGFSVIASAFMAEIYRSGLLSVPAGQREAAHALGMSPLTTARWVVSPQAFRVALPAIATYAIGLLKDSALASTIGVHDITYFAQQSAKQLHQGLLSFAIAGALYIIISLVIAVVSRRVHLKLRQKIGVA